MVLMLCFYRYHQIYEASHDLDKQACHHSLTGQTNQISPSELLLFHGAKNFLPMQLPNPGANNVLSVQMC